MEIDFDANQFFTAVSEGDPDSILAIKKQFVDGFNPKGWKLREKAQLPDLIKGLLRCPPIKWGYGMIVTDENGIVKSMLYSRFDRHKVFIYASKGYFTVQTPDMVFKRPTRRGVPTPAFSND